MATFLPWSSAEIGDLDIFAPAVPCLLVNTWYDDGGPDSTVSYFWQDERTGIVHHELLLHAPVTYEEAMDWAAAHAAGNDIERIHVRHAKRSAGRAAGKTKSRKVKSGSRRAGRMIKSTRTGAAARGGAKRSVATRRRKQARKAKAR